MKDCGGCTLCCELLPVPSLGKPPNEKCKHACFRCNIYDSRPAECRAIECLWRFGNLHDRLRPDRCGVVFELYKPEKTVVAAVDPARPNAIKEGATAALVERMLEDDYSVWVVVGEQKFVLLPEEGTKKESLAQLERAWNRKWQPQPIQPI